MNHGNSARTNAGDINIILVWLSTVMVNIVLHSETVHLYISALIFTRPAKSLQDILNYVKIEFTNNKAKLTQFRNEMSLWKYYE